MSHSNLTGLVITFLMVVTMMFVSTAECFVVQVPLFSSSSSSSSLSMTKLVYNGKAKDFPAGSPLSRAVAQLGVPVKYNCKKGDCATCQIRLAGQGIKCCVGKVPPEPRLKSLQEKGLEIRV